MKAIRVHEFGGPETLALEEVPDLHPGAGEVLVAIKAVGVNPVETYIRSGTYAAKPPLPYTPGSDAGGTVVQVGAGVSHVKAGDRVYIAGSLSGTYAEQALCREAQVHPLPDTASFQQGASMGVPYSTAFRALFHKAQLQAGETVFIHGASGGVGLAAVQLARSKGAIVIGTAGTDEGRRVVRENGADHVLDHRSPDVAKQVAEITSGRGPNVLLEMLANKNLAKDLQMIGLRGRVVIIGNRGTIEINPRDAMSRDAVIYGMTLMNVTPEELASIHNDLGTALRRGTIRPVIGREIPLAEARRAHEEVLQDGRYGKIILLP